MRNLFKYSAIVHLSVTYLLICFDSVNCQNSLPRLRRPQYHPKNKTLTTFPSVKNGDFVQKEEFQSFVSIQSKNGSFLCGGTLLDRDFVLTTASCLTKPDSSSYSNEELMVWSDINNAKNDTGKKEVSQIFIHPAFDPLKLTNDIAMLKIDPFAPGLKTETLTAIEPPSLNSSDCKIIGWGQESEGQFLYKITADIQNSSVCGASYSQFTGLDTAICVKGANNSCIEDSASALMCSNEIVGVLSFGYGCTDVSKPNIFTDVSKYNEWIDDNFRASPDNEPSTTVGTTTEAEDGTSTVTSPNFNFAKADPATTTEAGPNDPSTVTSVSVSFRTENPANQPDLDEGLNQNLNETEVEESPLEGSYQVVMDLCTASYVQCCPVWINGLFPTYQCRRGFYQYGCFYMVKQFVQEETKNLPPRQPGQQHPTPPISHFRSFVQHSGPERVSVIEQSIVHQIENQNRADAQRLGIEIPSQDYEPPNRSQNPTGFNKPNNAARPRPKTTPRPDRPQFNPPEEEEENSEPEQPVIAPAPVQPVYTTNEVSVYYAPAVSYQPEVTHPLYGYPAVQTYAQSQQNWFNEVYCQMIQRSNLARAQLGLPLIVSDSCSIYSNSISGSSGLGSRFNGFQDQRIYFPQD